MKNPSSRRISPRVCARKTGAAFGIAVVCSLFAGSASAQVTGVTISDPLGLVQEVNSATNTYAQLQNILMQAQSLGNNISLFDKPLTPITNYDPIISAACPGAGGGSIVGEALNAISSALNANASVASRQQIICTQIVVYQIDEYNKTVNALNVLGQYSNTTLAKLNTLTSSVSTLGTSSAAQTQAQQYSANVSTAMHTWQTQIQSDEEMVSALQKQQSILAKVAMNGNPTILGTVIQASALKLAFTVNQ